jgi:hypothetical protein
MARSPNAAGTQYVGSMSIARNDKHDCAQGVLDCAILTQSSFRGVKVSAVKETEAEAVTPLPLQELERLSVLRL